jgi:ferredoxin-NADP reductase
MSLGAGVVGLTLGARRGRLPAWTPGASVDIRLGNGLLRRYSLLGDPEERPRRYRIAVRLSRTSRGGSSWVHAAARRGADLAVSRPHPFPELPDTGALLFVGAGIGVVPLLPIARALAGRRAVRGVCVDRTRAEMPFLSELEELGWRILETARDGRPAPDRLLAIGDGAVVVCGPTEFIRDVRRAAADRTVIGDTPAEAAPARPFTLRLARSGRATTVRDVESIADALERLDVPVATSCGVGTCGTCLVAVRSGAVDHRDAVLSAAERHEGTVLAACVSRAAGALLELDR